MTKCGGETPLSSGFVKNTPTHNTIICPPPVAIEIVSEEEMALLDAALSAARRGYISSPRLIGNVRSITSVSLLAKRQSSEGGDIEDSGDFVRTQKRNIAGESFLRRYRKNKGLSVTDFTATEWCEKQMEFNLTLGKPKKTTAMKTGSARHEKLEEEVVKRVKIHTETIEDVWAVKFINFIVGTNQLFFEGLTRELPLLGFINGAWIVGVIDEIRMPINSTETNPKLVDTKTRVRPTFPSKPQQRNGRLQVMCYKLLWDNLATDTFSAKHFFDFFGLNPHSPLSEEVRTRTVVSGFEAQSLDDLVRHFRSACCVLPSAHDELLLRYEFQEDESLIGEDCFSYDSNWVKSQLEGCLEFWSGEREAKYVSDEERWKCGYCHFAPQCPANAIHSDH